VNFMKSIRSVLHMVALSGLALIMVACSVPQAAPQPTAPAAPLIPTVDMPALNTRVAKTVVAEITVQAALNPSPTVVPATVQPTIDPPTLAPTQTPAPVLVTTAVPILAQPSGATQTWAVQITPTKTAYPDKCELVSTKPSDGTVYDGGSPFEVFWVLKNTGVRPWNTQFYFKKVTGTLGNSTNVFLPSPVNTGNEFTLQKSMTAPETAGNYNGTYKLINDDGVAICQFYITITVR